MELPRVGMGASAIHGALAWGLADQSPTARHWHVQVSRLGQCLTVCILQNGRMQPPTQKCAKKDATGKLLVVGVIPAKGLCVAGFGPQFIFTNVQ